MDGCCNNLTAPPHSRHHQEHHSISLIKWHHPPRFCQTKPAWLGHNISYAWTGWTAGKPPPPRPLKLCAKPAAVVPKYTRGGRPHTKSATFLNVPQQCNVSFFSHRRLACLTHQNGQTVPCACRTVSNQTGCYAFASGFTHRFCSEGTAT